MELKMMNNRASLLLLVLFLYSCGANPDKSNENNSATNQETTADTL
ncbi:MAG: PBP1b-binding outer membrane lipoprotein LpoB, partial [Bacteroidia bacterium]